mmetsp:Transcript_47941/g.102778  ORF Transcript_47941/g.102778 Transcript_47941/m.102778 type:complete len:215 (-) Transcript_47941:117-761(-)
MAAPQPLCLRRPRPLATAVLLLAAALCAAPARNALPGTAAVATLVPPKGPRSDYILFCNAKRAEVKKDTSPTEKMKILGSLWQKLSDEEKTPWRAKAAEDKERFKKEEAEFVAGGGEMPKKGRKRHQVVAKKEKDEAKEKAEKKVKKPRSPSAYNIFMKENLQKGFHEAGPNAKAAEVMKEVAKEWKALSDEDRAAYDEQAAQAKAELLEALAA